MSTSTVDRIIQTPGETAPAAAAPVAPAAPAAAPAPARKKPGPKPRAAAAPDDADDDLADYDTETLPPAPVAMPASAAEFTPEQQRLIASMIAAAVGAARSSQDPQTAAKLAAAANTAQRLPTQAEAAAMCADMVSKGQRPRPILTPDGWFVHPEQVRTVDHGVAKLSVH
jgi:hypothetical protein